MPRTTLRQLTLSIKDLDGQEKAAGQSELSVMDQGQGGSHDACS